MHDINIATNTNIDLNMNSTIAHNNIKICANNITCLLNSLQSSAYDVVVNNIGSGIVT